MQEEGLIPSLRRKRQGIRALVGDTIGIVLGNAIPAYGVIFWDWPPFSLVALCILEGVIVLPCQRTGGLFRGDDGMVFYSRAPCQRGPRGYIFFASFPPTQSKMPPAAFLKGPMRAG